MTDPGYEEDTRRHRLPPGECVLCDQWAVTRQFHPSHDPSPRCESGGREHCTCSVCF